MKLTDIKNSLNEISAIGGLKQVVKGNTDRVEGIKLSKEMAQAMIDWFNSSPYGRKYPNAKKGRLHLSLGIMGSFGLDRYAKHKGAKEELKYIKTLSKAMRDNVNEESLNEGKYDDLLDKLADIVGNAKSFMDIGKELKSNKIKYSFGTSPLPMYIIDKPVKIAILNKKYVDGAEREVGSTAIGLMENLTTEGKDDFNASYSGVNINLKKGYKKHNENDLMNLYSQIGKAVNRMKGVKSVEVVFEGTINEVKYDIGMARKGNGITVYNRAEEEAGDYKNVAHIDTKGKIKYYDKKLPSKIKKQIEVEAKKMMEIKLEGTMKLKDILNESVLNERAEPMLTDKEQELVRKALERAVGVGVVSEPDDTRYHGGNSNFAFDGGEEMMLYVGYDEDDEEYNVSIESFDGGQIAQKNTKDLKSAIKVAMQMAKKYKKRLTSESVNEAKYHKSKDEFGARKAGAIYNNANAIVDRVIDDKADAKEVVSIMGPVLINAIKATIKHKFKPMPGKEKDLKKFQSKLKELLKLTEALVKKPSKAGVKRLETMHREWWNFNFGAAIVLNGDIMDSIVELKEAKYDKGTMKLKDILNESFENMKVYSNPFHSPFVKENEREETTEMSNEQKGAFLEAVKAYTSFGETVYRKEGLAKVYESIRNLVETAGKNMVKETEGSFDGITVGRHVKRMNESFKIFEKTLREVHTLQQRLESTYDEIGEVLGKYYEINELEEGNEFGAARAKAIANGDSEFQVDGKTYPVKSVDKDDKENAKKFANESTLNERADESLTDKEQELVRKTLERAVGVRVATDVTDLRYNTGTSEFIFDGGEEMMLYVGYDEDDEEYNVSIESFDGGQIAQKNTKDLKSAIKVAMQMAKKYKKRLTSESVNESKSMKLTSMLNESFGMGELPSEKLMKMKVSAKDMMDSVKNKTTKKIVEGYSTEEKRIVLLAVRKLMKYKNIDINLAAQYVVGAAEELKMDIDKGRVKK